MTGRHGTDRKPLRCALMIDDAPRQQIGDGPERPTTLRGWVAWAERKLKAKAIPEGTGSHIRGVKIAQDYVLEALLKYSRCAQFRFIVEPAKLARFQEWAADCSRKGKPSVEIYQASELRLPGFHKLAPDIWLDLAGYASYGLRLRDQLSSRIYPAVSLQHGLADHSLLYDLFLRILLTPSYPCDSLICTSSACKKALENIFEGISEALREDHGVKPSFAGRLDVIPLCVDTTLFRPLDKGKARKQLRIPEDSAVLLYLGYLSLIKADLGPILQMLRRLIDRNRDRNIQLIIAGTGPESYGSVLRALTQQLNLGKNTTMFREVSDAFKRQLYSAADVFVGPSDSFHESFGLTPVEAMACGLPQVVANWDGYRDTVSQGETGFLVPTYWAQPDEEFRGTNDILGWRYDQTLLSQSVYLDIGYMQACLEALIRNPELRITMSRNSRARAAAEFSFAKLAQNYDHLFEELNGIARPLERRRRNRTDRSTYFRFFQHFAERQLTGDCVVRTVSDSAISLSQAASFAEAALGMAVFDHLLLREILNASTDPAGRSTGRTVQQLISLTASRERSEDSVRRHILLLLKHGHLELLAIAAAT